MFGIILLRTPFDYTTVELFSLDPVVSAVACFFVSYFNEINNRNNWINFDFSDTLIYGLNWLQNIGASDQTPPSNAASDQGIHSVQWWFESSMAMKELNYVFQSGKKTFHDQSNI
jgi:hypothetical protein